MKRFLAVATFAGGCFWCMEPPFESLKGVVSVTSGYTAHHEAVEIRYDPQQITYAQLLDVFWRNIDPTDDGGQFCDRGPQYRAAIFVHDEAQRLAAQESKKAKKLRVVTEILPAGPFYRAEEYHQDYAKKNPVRYKFYRFNCGRDRVLKRIWRTP